MSNLTIPEILRSLQARQGKLAHRAIVDGEELNTSAITDASESIQHARTHYTNGDFDDAREALQLAAEQLDAAEG